MADNERVAWTSGDVGYQQLALAEANRTNFTPGKATGRPGDMNWPEDFRIPTGTPAFGGEAAGPVLMQRRRVVKLGRNVVSDQTLQGLGGTFPHTGVAKTTTIDDDTVWGTTTDPQSAVTPVTEDEADGRYERNAGEDRIASA